jgi:hypothetical protein
LFVEHRRLRKETNEHEKFRLREMPSETAACLPQPSWEW